MTDSEASPPVVPVETRSGLGIALCLASPSDGELLQRGFARLSDRSKYNRFFTGMSDLPEAMVHRLVDFEPGGDMGLVASDPEVADGPMDLAIGAARLSCSSGGAEISLTVIEAYQHRGVGRVLIAAICFAALVRGLERVQVEVLAVNRPMRALLKSMAVELSPADGDATVVLGKVDTEATAAGLDPSTKARLERLVLG